MHSLLEELVDQIPARPVHEVVVGTFTTAVVSERCGLASTLRQACGLGGHGGVRYSGEMVGMPVSELAQLVYSDNTLEASIGMASINSALPLPEEELPELNAARLLARRGRGYSVGVIGHFPFLGKLKEKVGELHIFEKNPRPGDLTESDMRKYLPGCAVVAISGTTLVNHSLSGILELCDASAYKLMLGPSTPLSPVLLEAGIDALCGTIVENEQTALHCLAQGTTFKGIKGVRHVTYVRDAEDLVDLDRGSS